MGHVERVQARGEAAMSELHGRLMAARVEVEASSARAEELSRQVAASSADASSRQRELEEAYHKAFHNHCLLAKLLLNTRKRVCAWHEGRHSRPLSTNSHTPGTHTRRHPLLLWGWPLLLGGSGRHLLSPPTISVAATPV